MAYILERLALTDSEIPVAPFQFTHMSLRDVEQVLRDRVVISRALAARAPHAVAGRAAAEPAPGSQPGLPATLPEEISSMREYIDEAAGDGYWDLFRLGPRMFVSITDVTYRRDTWIAVEGDAMFKLRILLQGRVLGSDKRVLNEGPSATLAVTATGADHGYFIAGRVPSHLVVIHAGTGAIASTLGVSQGEVPAPLDCNLDTEHALPDPQTLHMSPEVFRAANDMLESRSHFSTTIRRALIEAKSRELLCLLVQQLQDARTKRTVATSLSARDVHRIYEARDVLALNYADPPPIPKLSRAVGINQTKLKSGFKELIGCTTYEFVQQRRMERASELLLRGGMAIAEIARLVGYDYPANFTCAFRRYYGFLPKQMRRAQ